MWYVYVLNSTRQARFYIGVTEDIKKRLRKHNSGGVKSTKPYKPWNVFYIEDYERKSEAYKREYYLKHPSGYQEKLRLIQLYKSGEVA